MAKILYSKNSPYAVTPQAQWYLGIYKHRTIAPASDDITITLSPHHAFRPDILSQELYGTPTLWWVFMLRNMNKIRDPLNDFNPGKVIFAPSLNSLKKSIGI